MHTQSTDVKSKKIQQGEATRHALLDAARRLLGEQGYVATSLDEIAQAANVTKGARQDVDSVLTSFLEGLRPHTTDSSLMLDAGPSTRLEGE